MGNSHTSGRGGGAAIDSADYLVGTANPNLSAEIVAGAAPAGELGGTWGGPTVNATHSGSAHHAQSHTQGDHSAVLSSLSSGFAYVRKTGDETVNGSDVLQNDDALLFAIGANEVWEFEFVLQTDSGTTPDFKHGISLPAGATLLGVASLFSTALAHTISTITGAAVSSGGAGAGTNLPLVLKGVVVNGANAGTVQLQWAQNTANASDTKVKANSYVFARRLA